jgi:hypothetical protein
MTRDLGIVYLPNEQCRLFAEHMTSKAGKALPNYKEAANNPHITAIHIANLDPVGEMSLRTAFKSFAEKYSSTCIILPIKGINATGGSQAAGYKWLDLQFETLPELALMRQDAVDTFCPHHNGMLTRMSDDYANFNEAQLAQIEHCGVTYSPYLPHITAWYVDLPIEQKTTVLQDVANAMASEANGLNCYAESIALVELGRNGNAINILEQYPLCLVEAKDNSDEL